MFGIEAMQVAFLVVFLLVACGLIAGTVFLIRRVSTGKMASIDTGNRDRALLARLEELDDRLERLEKTLNDLPA